MFQNFDDRQDVQTYFSQKVNPIFCELMKNLVKNRPENIVDYSFKWFRQNVRKDQDFDSDKCISEEDFIAWRRQRIENGLRRNRHGISSEVYRRKTQRNKLSFPKTSIKSEETHMKILFSCTNNFLFKNFNEQQIDSLIRVMQKIKTQKDQIIIDDDEHIGDSIYFIDQGVFEWMMNGEKGKKKTIKYYHVGQNFGQIYLLHAIKGYGTVISRSEGILYRLRRETYTHFMYMSVAKKRQLYMEVLRKQDLFAKFKKQEIDKICDVLAEVTYKQDQYIINQGDYGVNFYIIVQGFLVAFQGNQENIVKFYKEGDAFGQLALIKDKPRQASVKSLTKVKLVYITQEIFKRIFKNVDLEKQIEEKYVRRPNCITQKKALNG